MKNLMTVYMGTLSRLMHSRAGMKSRSIATMQLANH